MKFTFCFSNGAGTDDRDNNIIIIDDLCVYGIVNTLLFSFPRDIYSISTILYFIFYHEK